jgi:heme-degrading monooxygenase HmoA
MLAFHLAEVNIAIPVEPLDSARLAEFMHQLDPVNAVADASPGFVWRMQDDSGNNTDIRGFGDERVVVNMSVWESLDALRAFVYSSRAHRDVLRRRREWFERLSFYLALWWVPAGHRPTVDKAEKRLTRLERLGPTPEAFTFRVSFPPPDAANPQRCVRRPRALPCLSPRVYSRSASQVMPSRLPFEQRRPPRLTEARQARVQDSAAGPTTVASMSRPPTGWWQCEHVR